MQTASLAAIEIGGTKLQLGIASSDSLDQLQAVWRADIDRAAGAIGILAQIEEGMRVLSQDHRWNAIGIGFGGPVDTQTGRVTTSHQVHGWDHFELADWCHARWPVPVAVDNDCNVAALAEARLGAGRGFRRVLYVTVGTGIGGGFVIDGQIDGSERPAITEIGHLRPGLDATDSSQTVESLASGLGMEQTLRRSLEPLSTESLALEANGAARDLWNRCHGDWSGLNARLIAAAAADQNELAIRTLQQGTRVLGWALAQATTLLAPERLVLGGGVTSIPGFVEQAEQWWQSYLFPPLAQSGQIVRAQLGDQVVLFGGLLLAYQKLSTR